MVALERINFRETVGRKNNCNLNFFSMYFVRNNEEIHLSFKNSEKWWTQALRISSVNVAKTVGSNNERIKPHKVFMILICMSIVSRRCTVSILIFSSVLREGFNQKNLYSLQCITFYSGRKNQFTMKYQFDV